MQLHTSYPGATRLSWLVIYKVMCAWGGGYIDDGSNVKACKQEKVTEPDRVKEQSAAATLEKCLKKLTF